MSNLGFLLNEKHCLLFKNIYDICMFFQIKNCTIVKFYLDYASVPTVRQSPNLINFLPLKLYLWLMHIITTYSLYNIYLFAFIRRRGDNCWFELTIWTKILNNLIIENKSSFLLFILQSSTCNFKSTTQSTLNSQQIKDWQNAPIITLNNHPLQIAPRLRRKD